MQQSIIQSASETWQAVKHEEQKRLRDTERYEKLAQSAAISQQIIDNARFDYQQVAAKERKAANDFLVEEATMAVLSAQEEKRTCKYRRSSGRFDSGTTGSGIYPCSCAD
ncbi:hypothetical protein OH693_04705 [Escherichia coli]|nr:hypothetical protein [Escherichia coli]